MLPARTEPTEDTPIAIRRAGAPDLDFIKTLCREVFLVYGSYDRYVDEWFHADVVETVVADIEGAPVGFAMLALYPPAESSERAVAELLAIAVSREYRSRGVANALLERCFSLARESSLAVSEIRLSVAEGNARAQRMFARKGFRILPQKGIYPAGQRAILMSMKLQELRSPRA